MTPFFMALGMFSIIPNPVKKWDEKRGREMLLFMPVIGLIIGALWSLLALWIGNMELITPGGGVKGLFAAGVMAIFPLVLSGFIHLDGYMDVADAVLSRRDKERRIEILKDSHVGAFAVIMLVILGMLSLGVFSDVSLAGREWILLFIPAVSRGTSVFFIYCLKPLKTSSYKKMHEEKLPPKYVIILLVELLIFFVGAYLLVGRSALVLGIELFAASIVVAVSAKNLGGMSGDISGSAITISEIVAVAALLFIK